MIRAPTGAMKICFFYLMPYRFLPDDFEHAYRSVWVDVPHSLYDPVKTHGLYNEYLDELEFAERMGFDGLCVNEHHNNAYGLMPSPNLMAAALTRRTSRAYLDQGYVIAGSPATVREQLTDCIKGLRVGHLMVLLQIGSMPRELTLKNTEQFAREVLPHVRDIWPGYQDRWWPAGLPA